MIDVRRAGADKCSLRPFESQVCTIMALCVPYENLEVSTSIIHGFVLNQVFRVSQITEICRAKKFPCHLVRKE
jgi:hypothetical protein